MDVISSLHIESSEVIQLGKRTTKIILITLCMLLLILDAKTAGKGAVDGLYLCIQTLVPSLFPFILVSILLTDTLAGFTSSMMRPIYKLLRIPDGAESLFLIGMVGGYPVGAQIISHAVDQGRLTNQDGSRMLSFCNNAGPAFLFGVVSSQFPSSKYVWLIWIILILSAILTGAILPGTNIAKSSIEFQKSMTITQAMEKALKIMAGICGWVIIFRVILAFTERWFLWLLPETLRVIAEILLELANGCTSLNTISNIGLRFIVSIMGLSIGGFCVLLQTLSVSGSLRISKYIFGKLLQTTIAVLLAIPVALFLENTTSELILTAILLTYALMLVILSNCRKKAKLNMEFQ